DQLFTGNTAPGPVPQFPDFHPADVGLWVLPGGTLNFSGEQVTSWINAVGLYDRRPRAFQKGISRSLAFSNGRARLAGEPEGWREGDQLLLVSEKGEDALAVLTSFSGGYISYELAIGETPIEGYVLHVDADEEKRAIHPKVANLSRRLRIISADVSPSETNHRAHTIYLEGSHISLRSVEFKNLGPRGKLGRYPIHWHHARSTQDTLEGSSIWQSVDEGSNRFVTMHIVSGVRVSNNVGYRSQGHGFFMEELMEFDNVVAGNLSVDVRYGEELSNIDESISGKTHHFWMRAGNEISGNVAAGHNWRGEGKGNHTPPIEGLVVLPSSENDPEPVVSDFECLGCGGVGMWTAVPNTLFERPVSSYTIIAAFRSWDTWNIDSSGTKLNDPLFILNGNNDLFTMSKDYSDSVPWASQIYLNYGEVAITGGTIAGNVGIHSHYRSRFSINNTRMITKTLIDPTYWETTAVIEDSLIDTNNIFSHGYGANRRASPGLVVFRNSCFKGSCKNSKLSSRGYSGYKFSPMFADYRKTSPSNTYWVQFPETELQTGFIKAPAEESVKFWSVTPTSISSSEDKIIRITENEGNWRKYFGKFGGFMDGFPPGEYRVNLYKEDSEESIIRSETVIVHPGQVTQL
ncbi:MAG: hypothetical protein JKY51_11225, partial [Opitutaceae bacterium]|nr:hypothetical protein [Opitutaceae bacterium]